MIFCPLPIRSFRITQKFGANPEYYKKYGHKGHNGLDFAPLIPGMKGQVIYAPHEGYAKCFLDDTGYGNYITISSLPHNKDGIGRKSDLAHMEKFLITDGYVAAGDPIGIMGNTGDSTGIHLHWAYKATRDGLTVDKDNGYAGALNIGPYALPLVLQPLIRY